MRQRPVPGVPAAEVRRDHDQIRHLADQVRQPLRAGKIVAVVAHVHQHREAAPRDGAIRFDAGGIVDRELLKIRMDLQAPRTQRLQLVEHLFISVHARIDGAEGNALGIALARLCQKFHNGAHLLRHDRRAADDIPAHAGLLFLRDEPLHACLAVHLCSIKLPDRPRGLHGQLFREHMGMHICNFHLSNRPKPHKIA